METVQPERVNEDLGRDAHIVGTISLAHFFSHFYQFSLPVLFPMIRADYGVTYAELGLLVTFFYGASGLAQTAAGFLVDRAGPARVLAAGLGLLAASMAMVALVPQYWMMLPAAALAGLGNSVFHPADYSIMSHRVAPRRIGKAFAIHAVSGTLGYTAAPIAMVGIAHLLSWQGALLIGAAGGFCTFLLVLARLKLLGGGAPVAPRPAGRSAATGLTALAALRQSTVLLCFSFFLLMAVPSVGLSGFLATILQKLFATPLTVSAHAFAAYLGASVFGVLGGGILADRMQRHERVVMTSVMIMAAIFFSVGFIGFDAAALTALLAAAGFSSGLAAPSRDMLVRAAAAHGAGSATGKVFGFAYSGFDLGAALAPPFLGFMLDRGLTQWVMPVIASSLLLVILSALNVSQSRSPRPQPQPI
jgi:MFS family permease